MTNSVKHYSVMARVGTDEDPMFFEFEADSIMWSGNGLEVVRDGEIIGFFTPGTWRAWRVVEGFDDD